MEVAADEGRVNIFGRFFRLCRLDNLERLGKIDYVVKPETNENRTAKR
jgi:hypothetical protein